MQMCKEKSGADRALGDLVLLRDFGMPCLFAFFFHSLCLYSPQRIQQETLAEQFLLGFMILSEY